MVFDPGEEGRAIIGPHLLELSAERQGLLRHGERLRGGGHDVARGHLAASGDGGGPAELRQLRWIRSRLYSGSFTAPELE